MRRGRWVRDEGTRGQCGKERIGERRKARGTIANGVRGRACGNRQVITFIRVGCLSGEHKARHPDIGEIHRVELDFKKKGGMRVRDTSG